MEFLQNISKEITKQKYYLHGETTKEELFRGVAKELASVEKGEAVQKYYENQFYGQMESGKLIPGGRILANARVDSRLKNYNNCFTIDIEDSMDGITNSLMEYMKILKTGGGVGFDISKLRPKGADVSTGGNSSGPMSFLEIFDSASKTIRVGGGRRGASIAILRCDHPDIEEFITYKQGDENKKLTQFNISVGITDEFMHAVEQDADWDLVWGGKIYKTVKAKDLYDLITDNAFTHNEPGVLFLDTVEKYNTGSYAFRMDRCNPCGEIVMPAYSLCCLSSLNLARFVINPFTDEAKIDWDAIAETVKLAVRFLDNVLDATEYPLDKIEEFSKLWRRIGLGITGLGDMFAMLKIKYGSDESIVISEAMSQFIMNHAYLTSVELAKEKGPFPALQEHEKDVINGEFIKKLDKPVQDGIAKFGLRNIGLLTIAPTGTTSLSLGENCSSGIEPIFSIKYDRTVKDLTVAGEETLTTETVYDYAWLKFLQQKENANLHMDDNDGAPEYFVTTKDIDARASIAIQKAWQDNIDHSISKTLNLAPGTTKEEYNGLFFEAWQSGLKGFTTFNPEGSMKGILDYGDKKKEPEERIIRHNAPKRPKELPCDIYEVKVKGVPMLVLVGLLHGEPYEFFCTPNEGKAIDVNHHKTGIIKKVRKGRYDLVITNGEDKVVAEDIGHTFDEEFLTIARMGSGMLRHGADIKFVIDQLNKTENIGSFQKATSRGLKHYITDGKIATYGEAPKCEVCEAELIMKEGCMTCQECGWSKCS